MLDSTCNNCCASSLSTILSAWYSLQKIHLQTQSRHTLHTGASGHSYFGENPQADFTKAPLSPFSHRKWLSGEGLEEKQILLSPCSSSASSDNDSSKPGFLTGNYGITLQAQSRRQSLEKAENETEGCHSWAVELTQT